MSRAISLDPWSLETGGIEPNPTLTATPEQAIPTGGLIAVGVLAVLVAGAFWEMRRRNRRGR